MLIQLISDKMAQLEVQRQPLDHRELHALCLRQEKIVMSEIVNMQHLDIYQ